MSSSAIKSILLQRLRGEQTARVPVWFMRQAGRYLPEYRELRKKQSMLDAIRSPETAAEITLQPLRRFDLDAGIIFADILNPLIGMGIELDFIAGEGPKIFNPIASRSDVEKLRIPEVKENVGYTLRAIEIVVRELSSKGTPLLGFSGAPFTLSSYLIKGSESPIHAALKKFVLHDPAAWVMLQEKLTALVSDYLIAQALSGVAAVQLFDSWVGALGPMQFSEWVAPSLRMILTRVREKTSVPVIYFATGAAGLLPEIGKIGFDTVGVDWRVSLSAAAKLLGSSVPLQGNLDPLLLCGSFDQARAAVDAVLTDGVQISSHIFNVGHGLTPETNPDTLARVVEVVHEFTPAIA